MVIFVCTPAYHLEDELARPLQFNQVPLSTRRLQPCMGTGGGTTTMFAFSRSLGTLQSLSGNFFGLEPTCVIGCNRHCNRHSSCVNPSTISGFWGTKAKATTRNTHRTRSSSHFREELCSRTSPVRVADIFVRAEKERISHSRSSAHSGC